MAVPNNANFQYKIRKCFYKRYQSVYIFEYVRKAYIGTDWLGVM